MQEKEEFIQIENNENTDISKVNLERYDITSYPADYTVSTLLEKVNKGLIVLPEFQRKFVWNEIKQSRLIESFLLGLPVPQIFLFRKIADPKLYIIDGFQRINTLRRFFAGELVLTNINEKWTNKKISELSEEDRSILEDSVIRAIIIRQISPKNESSSMFHIYERLNTGGVVLTPMEIRKAIYYGHLFEMLERLNKDDNWRKIIGKKEEDRRLRDIEWILRFFAFLLSNIERDYIEPLKEFLNKFMENNRNLASEGLENSFKKTCALIIDALGERPFHIPKGRLNLAVMDCIMVAIAKNITLSQEEIRKKYEELKSDQEFINLISVRDTSKAVYVRDRFRKAFEKFGAQ